MPNKPLKKPYETLNKTTGPSLSNNRSKILCIGNEASVIKDGWHYDKNMAPTLKSQGIPLLLTKINVDTTKNLKPVCSPTDNSIKKKYVMLVKIDRVPGQNNSINNDSKQMFILLPYKMHDTNLNPVGVLGKHSKNVKLMKGNWIPEQDNFINDNIDNGVVNNNELIKQEPENRDMNLNLTPIISINKVSGVPFKQDDSIVDTTSESKYHQNNILPFQPNDNLNIPKEICQTKKQPKFRKLYNIDNYDMSLFPEEVYERPEYKPDSHLGFKTPLDFNGRRSGSNSTLDSKENSTLQRESVVSDRRSTRNKYKPHSSIIKYFTEEIEKINKANLKKIKKNKKLI